MAAPQASRHGSSRPGGTTRKTTLQKMLDLEKRNKVGAVELDQVLMTDALHVD